MKRDLNGMPLRQQTGAMDTDALASEANTRANADTTLGAAIDTERTDRVTEIAGERTRLDSVQADAIVLNNKIGAVGGLAELDGGGKLPMNRLPLSTVVYCGTWNAATNTPIITSGQSAMDAGCYRIISVGGSSTVDGESDWAVRDWIIWNGIQWSKVDNTSSVTAVNNLQGAVVLDLETLNNVTINAVGDGEILKYNGVEWVNNTLSEAGVPQLNDTALTGTTTIENLLLASASVKLGFEAGHVNQGGLALSAGFRAGSLNQGDEAVALGFRAGNNGQQPGSVAAGPYSGESGQGTQCVAVGGYSGQSNQESGAIGVGVFAGNSGQETGSVAVGRHSGRVAQGFNSVAVGESAARLNQANSSVAIGHQAGHTSQHVGSVSIGRSSGTFTQREESVAIGSFAGHDRQATYSVAIGVGAGRNVQQSHSTAVGALAGHTNMGAASIALGYGAGHSNQHSNTTVINSTGGFLNTQLPNALYVAPIRQATGTHTLQYNAATKEITYN